MEQRNSVQIRDQVSLAVSNGATGLHSKSNIHGQCLVMDIITDYIAFLMRPSNYQID
jgi:hypothetical protein